MCDVSLISFCVHDKANYVKLQCIAILRQNSAIKKCF